MIRYFLAFSFAAVAVSSTCFGQTKSRRYVQPTSKFGTIYPELEKCLEFSEDTGAWTMGRGTSGFDEIWKFEQGGRLIVLSEKNEFGRVVDSAFEMRHVTGTWSVQKRSGNHTLELAFEKPNSNAQRATLLLVEQMSRVDRLHFEVQSSTAVLARSLPPGKVMEFRHASSYKNRLAENTRPEIASAVSPPDLPNKAASPDLSSKIESVPDKASSTRSDSTRTDSIWLSQNATYRVSSQYEQGKPLASLLNDSEELYETFNGVTYGRIIKDGQYAFSSNNEPGAHIQIDLGASREITGIYIRNKQHSDAAVARAKDLAIWISDEARSKGSNVWSADKAEVEWNVVLSKPTRGRFITIGFPETKREYLHLTKVKVFGGE